MFITSLLNKSRKRFQVRKYKKKQNTKIDLRLFGHLKDPQGPITNFKPFLKLNHLFISFIPFFILKIDIGKE